jgi:probable HAF family extracellular repeat protein
MKHEAHGQARFAGTSRFVCLPLAERAMKCALKINVALLLLLLGTLAPAQTQNAQTQNTSAKRTSPPTYVVTTLPAYWSGETGIGWAISNTAVAGQFRNQDNYPRAALFALDGKSFQDLGILPGGTISSARALNDVGQAVGFADGPLSAYRAVLFSYGGAVIEIPSFPDAPAGAYAQTFASGINNLGQVVGYGYYGYGVDPEHGFMYQNGELTDLGANYTPLAINASGQSVGQVNLHAAFFHDGTVDDLGVLGGDNFSVALAINDSGAIVGSSYKCNYTERIPGCFAKDFNYQTHHFFSGHGFLFQDGKMKALPSPRGYLQTQAMGINKAGTIVGCGLADLTTGNSALIWFDGKAYDLNTLVPPGSPHITCAFGINDAGQIVTYDSLLTPVAE